MIITWKGQSCFQISTSQGKNGLISIVIDPFSDDLGLKVPKLQADVLLISHDHSDHNNIKSVSGDPFIINGAGEYDIKEISIEGMSAFHDNSEGKERGKTTIYTIETEKIRLCHLGDLGQKELTEEQLEKIGDVDILMIPIGGTFTINANEAVKIMSQIEPRIILPMHYNIPKLKLKLDGIDQFLKVLGIKSLEAVPKLAIKKKDISGDEVKVIILEQ
ncbi:MAG: MBL fold metallo-hydrolase [Candidatus Nealsonbacteria bacterium]